MKTTPETKIFYKIPIKNELDADGIETLNKKHNSRP